MKEDCKLKKDFLNELIDALTELRDNQKQITISAPPSPAAVLKTVGMVAKNHEITAEDMEVAMAIRSISAGGVSTAEIQAVQDMKSKLED